MMNRTLSVVTIGLASAFLSRQASAWDQPPGARAYVIESGCDYPGFDYSRGTANDARDCGNQCLADTYCTTFEFNTSNHFCYLKNGRPQITAVSSDGVCGVVDPRWEWDIDRPHLDIAWFWRGSPEDCQAACFANPNCVTWNFDSAAAQVSSDTPSCWLKNGVPDPVERRGGVSYCAKDFQRETSEQLRPDDVCSRPVWGHLVSGRVPGRF
jgi:hypothetical protein